MKKLLMLTMVLLAFLGGCGDDDGGDGEAGGGPSTVETTPAETTTETTAEEGADGCREVAQPEPKRDGGEEKPTEELSGDYSVTFETNCGSFTVDVNEDAGLTAASFVQLAESGFYEDTYFHRIVPGFVIQGGDPTGTGTGGPGYTTEDAPPTDATYEKGTVAMAKAGPEPPGTAGSQFFVVTDDAGGQALTPDYAIVGEVSDGLDVVTRIGELGDAAEQPTQVVKIEKATVEGG